MKATGFCYWLQGYFEIGSVITSEARKRPEPLTSDQVTMIQRHLALVFKHDIDLSQGSPQHQADLQAIHDGDQPDLTVRC